MRLRLRGGVPRWQSDQIEEAPRESCGKPRMARVLGGGTFTSSLDEQEMEVSATSIDRYHGSYLMPSLEQAPVAGSQSRPPSRGERRRFWTNPIVSRSANPVRSGRALVRPRWPANRQPQTARARMAMSIPHPLPGAGTLATAWE